MKTTAEILAEIGRVKRENMHLFELHPSWEFRGIVNTLDLLERFIKGEPIQVKASNSQTLAAEVTP